jgi:hypothetical protein
MQLEAVHFDPYQNNEYKVTQHTGSDIENIQLTYSHLCMTFACPLDSQCSRIVSVVLSIWWCRFKRELVAFFEEVTSFSFVLHRFASSVIYLYVFRLQ